MAPGDPPLRLFLIRHGETEWTLCGRHTGRTDIPLTARGEDAARALGRRLRGIPFARVLTSPRQRARRTCELARLGPGEIELDLVEWDYGDYEGRESVDIRGERPDWDLFRDGCPGGELPAQVADRADRLIARLRAQDGNVALFSHGQFGCVLAARWIGWPVIGAQHFPLATASLSILGYDPHHAVVPILALWNAVSDEVFDSASYPRLGVDMTMKQGAIERWEGEGGAIPADHRATGQPRPTTTSLAVGMRLAGQECDVSLQPRSRPMKKLALMLCGLLVVAGVAFATQATDPAKPAKAAAPADMMKPAVAKTHVVEAEVVSADAVAKTLTVKTEKGESTMKVDAIAAKHLTALRAGEKVKLTCRDNDKGEHEAVSHIVVEKAPAPVKK